MSKGLELAKRGILLLIVWSLASVYLFHAVAGVIEHRRMAGEVVKLEAEYDARLDDYTKLLAEGEKIRGDEATQVELLKDQLGYTELDETPIIVLMQD